jgi:hypothetical protein
MGDLKIKMKTFMEILRDGIYVNIMASHLKLTGLRNKGDSIITEVKDTGVITRGINTGVITKETCTGVITRETCAGVITRGTSKTGMEGATPIRNITGDMMGIIKTDTITRRTDNTTVVEIPSL